MEQSRIYYLDILRIIATLGMVTLHVSASCFGDVMVGTRVFSAFNFYESLVRFCVPVFVMISGALFLNPALEIRTVDLYRVNIKRIAISFAFWSFLYVAYTYYKDAVIGGQERDGLLWMRLGKDFIYGHYHMWFLYMIVGLYIITPILRKITEDRTLERYFIILSVIFCFSVNLLKYLPQFGIGISTVMANLRPALVLGYSGYFLAGDYIHRYGISRKLRSTVYILAAVSTVFTFAATEALSTQSGVLDSSLYEFLMLNSFLPGAAVFIWTREHLGNYSPGASFGKKIVGLSNLTFGIYLVHDFFIMILKAHGISTLSFNAFFSVPVLALGIFAASWAVTAVIHLIPGLRRTI